MPELRMYSSAGPAIGGPELPDLRRIQQMRLDHFPLFCS
jgi:hypothetical protein